MKTQRTGKHAEDLALKYLLTQNLSLLQRNYRCNMGEVDLVMRDQKSLVFIEVRFRQHADFGGALESVDCRKQRKIIRTATHYLQANQLLDHPARIDVFALSALDLSPGSFLWVQNAVEA